MAELVQLCSTQTSRLRRTVLRMVGQIRTHSQIDRTILVLLLLLGRLRRFGVFRSRRHRMQSISGGFAVPLLLLWMWPGKLSHGHIDQVRSTSSGQQR